MGLDEARDWKDDLFRWFNFGKSFECLKAGCNQPCKDSDLAWFSWEQLVPPMLPGYETFRYRFFLYD